MFEVTIRITQDGLNRFEHPDIEMVMRGRYKEDIKRNIAAALTIANVPSEEDDSEGKFDKGGILPC